MSITDGGKMVAIPTRPRINRFLYLVSMLARHKYSDITEAMQAWMVQVVDSIPFAERFLPNLSTPYELWNMLRPLLTFKHDPKNTELFQMFPTLINNNYHGISGAGDCDCFVIATLASYYAMRWKFPARVVLAGRNKRTPVHIYMQIQYNKEWQTLDFTQCCFNDERHYPYVQYLKIPKFSYIVPYIPEQ